MTAIAHVTLLVVAAIVSHLSTSCALLQERLPGVALSDSNVIGVLDSLGEDEIEAAQLAQEKASMREVQRFAGRVLNEHRQLAESHRRLGAQLPAQPEPSALTSQLKDAHQDAMRELRALSGAAFDRAYVEYEITRHISAFHFVEAAADTEGNPVLKQELVRTGPDLLSHISAARALERHLASEPKAAIAAR